MSDRGPTWGSVLVMGMAGFAGGLLVAAVLVAGRTPARPAGFTGYAPAPAETAQPATVTITGLAPPPSTVTARPKAVSPSTTTSILTVEPTTSSTPDTTTTSPTDVETGEPSSDSP